MSWIGVWGLSFLVIFLLDNREVGWGTAIFATISTLSAWLISLGRW